MQVLYGILLICGFTATALAKPPKPGFCGPDEVFNGCASACQAEPSCTDPFPDYAGFCTEQCVARCECDSSRGYIRDLSTGLCVYKKFCPTYPDYCDGRHEVLNECASSCVAEPSCNDPYPQQTGICNKMCVIRCECDVENGYVRDFATGKCVRLDKCPAIDYCDGRHEVLNECASSCIAEPSCLDPYPQPTGICNLMCIKRCECDVDNGYVRDLDTGRCIRKDKCPATCNCGFGEVFNECASSCLAEPTCQDPTPDQEGICTYQCVQRCECDASKGYIRDRDTGICVLRNDCPVPCADTCGFGEVFNDCASSCLAEPTCQDPTPDQEGLCTYQCVQRCECDASKGYIRDTDTGRCVLRNDCPVPCAGECPDNEHIGCETCCPESVETCQNRNPKPCNKMCTTICKWGCQCDEGYIRDEISNRCVRPYQCPNYFLHHF